MDCASIRGSDEALNAGGPEEVPGRCFFWFSWSLSRLRIRNAPDVSHQGAEQPFSFGRDDLCPRPHHACSARPPQNGGLRGQTAFASDGAGFAQGPCPSRRRGVFHCLRRTSSTVRYVFIFREDGTPRRAIFQSAGDAGRMLRRTEDNKRKRARMCERAQSLLKTLTK